MSLFLLEVLLSVLAVCLAIIAIIALHQTNVIGINPIAPILACLRSAALSLRKRIVEYLKRKPAEPEPPAGSITRMRMMVPASEGGGDAGWAERTCEKGFLASVQSKLDHALGLLERDRITLETYASILSAEHILVRKELARQQALIQTSPASSAGKALEEAQEAAALVERCLAWSREYAQMKIEKHRETTTEESAATA